MSWCHKSSRCSLIAALTSWQSASFSLISRTCRLFCILPDPKIVLHLSRITQPLCWSSTEYPRLATTLTEKRFFAKSGTYRTSTNLARLYSFSALYIKPDSSFSQVFDYSIITQTISLWVYKMIIINHHFLIIWHVLWNTCRMFWWPKWCMFSCCTVWWTVFPSFYFTRFVLRFTTFSCPMSRYSIYPFS